MKIFTSISKELLDSIDALNTVGGGIVAPMTHMEEKDGGMMISVRVPGLRKERLKAELTNNVLFIYQLVDAGQDGNNVHRILHHMPLGFDISIKEVTAHFEDDTLFVFLPFNDFHGGYHRKLTIY